MIEQYSSLLNFGILLATAIGLVWGYVLWVHKWVIKMWEVICSIVSAILSTPDLIGTMTQIADKLDRIHKQVFPNGGLSNADALLRLENMTRANTTQLMDIAGRQQDNANNLARLDNKIEVVATTIKANQDSDPRRATFVCDHEGKLIELNKTYLKWTKLVKEEMLRFGWFNSVHPLDRDRVREEVHQALFEVRTCSVRYRMMGYEDEVHEVESTMTPIPEGVDQPDRWIGVIFKVDKHDTPTQ